MSIDRSGLASGELGPVFAEAKRVIQSRRLGSVRTLADVTGVRYGKNDAEAMRRYVEGNTPYVLARAVLGLDGLGRVISNIQ